MWCALFYKEWIKTRRAIGLLALILLALVVYVFIYTGQLFRVHGAVQVWNGILLKDFSILPAFLKWFPLLAGFTLAMVQYIPEMTDKRLKLTLHLPLTEFRISTSMLIYGALVLALLFALFLGVLTVGLSNYYTVEIVKNMIYALTPALLAGFTSYFFAAWACLEPVWKQRVFRILVAVAGLYLFFFDVKPGAYIYFMPFLFLIVCIGFFFPLYSISRFKDGNQ